MATNSSGRTTHMAQRPRGWAGSSWCGAWLASAVVGFSGFVGAAGGALSPERRTGGGAADQSRAGGGCSSWVRTGGGADAQDGAGDGAGRGAAASSGRAVLSFADSLVTRGTRSPTLPAVWVLRTGGGAGRGGGAGGAGAPASSTTKTCLQSPRGHRMALPRKASCT